jgi:hypothetical protein
LLASLPCHTCECLRRHSFLQISNRNSKDDGPVPALASRNWFIRGGYRDPPSVSLLSGYLELFLRSKDRPPQKRRIFAYFRIEGHRPCQFCQLSINFRTVYVASLISNGGETLHLRPDACRQDLPSTYNWTMEAAPLRLWRVPGAVTCQRALTRKHATVDMGLAFIG